MRATFFAIFWVAACTGAQAQAVTDLELRAAYCLGVSISQNEIEGGKAKNSTSGPERAIHKDAANNANKRRARFLAYLQARGFGAERDIFLLKPTIDRGRGDVTTCQSETAQPYYKNCFDQCSARFDRSPGSENDVREMFECESTCPAPTCDRLRKCLEEFLPF